MWRYELRLALWSSHGMTVSHCRLLVSLIVGILCDHRHLSVMEEMIESSWSIRGVSSYRCPVEPPPRSDRSGAQVLPPSTSAPAHYFRHDWNVGQKRLNWLIANTSGQTWRLRQKSRNTGGDSVKPIKTGLVVAHSSSRPAQGVGGCLLPIPWPFGDTPHNPLPEVSGERPFGS